MQLLLFLQTKKKINIIVEKLASIFLYKKKTAMSGFTNVTT